MNSELSFRIIFLTFWIALTAIMLYYTGKTRKPGVKFSIRERLFYANLKEASRREGKLNLVLRAALSPFWVAAVALYLIYPDWMTHYTIPLPIWLRWTGVSVSIISLPLLAWAQHTLGKEYARILRVRKEQTLVTSGPYRWIRHPMYTAGSVFMIGLAVESANWLVAPPTLAGIVLLCARAWREENMLIERFGDKYRAYMKRTGRFLPRSKGSNK